jgi:hypothetical protein
MPARRRGYSREFPQSETSHNYLLYKVPAPLWAAAKKRARRDRLSMRAAILTLIKLYADDVVTITDTSDDALVVVRPSRGGKLAVAVGE